ncbi:DUF6171 family protein [Gorillibacterium sp. CAU 1737]|uniref:DUF6171 family protein n=1 Tax=Gorillibacterium sp. CAU 1737 TaxID=3140362 RepID=UPI003261C99A
MRTVVQADAPCKGCRETVRPGDDRIAVLVDKIRKGSDRELASDDEYARRLAACRVCESLQYDSTCKHCGCLVDIRALQQESACPFPYAPKW